MRRGGIAALACLIAGWGAPGALAAPSVSLHVSLHPRIPGHATTIRLRMRVAPGQGEAVPPPLTTAQLRYPAGLDVQLSGLGIDACTEATLALHGPGACPRDSRMGHGHATAEMEIEGEVARETARIAILRAPERDGHVAMTLVVYHEPALSMQIPLPTVLLPAESPFGGSLAIAAPLLTTVPEGPYLSVTEIDLVLGPKHLIYTERRHGRTIRYRPRGIPLPERCPHGGFPFTLRMSFLDGSHATARTRVRCPLSGRSRSHRRGRGPAGAAGRRAARSGRVHARSRG